MKLKFKQQAFQTDAVTAVVDLFRGQEKRQDTFTIVNEQQLNLDAGLGVGNALTIPDEQLVANMNEVQKRHSLPLTADLSGNQFCVEMETGTGKTYVYTKTIFELHKQYGFTKFIVVVPSVAIREGVYKSFQITAEHFAAQFDNTPVRCFIYVTKSGTIRDTMKEALAAGTLDLPAKFEAARQKFETVIAKANTRPPVQDASKEVRVWLKKEVMISPEFMALWEKIKGRTA
jgi:type III restriction enzyme